MEVDEEFANGPYVRTRVTANTSARFKVPGTITRFWVESRLSSACLVPRLYLYQGSSPSELYSSLEDGDSDRILLRVALWFTLRTQRKISN